jgi:ERCC4-related helicase
MFVEHPLIRKDKLSPRPYQESIVAQCLDQNTLVVLPTGLGKTIVALMIAAHRLKTHPGSKVLFLAPTKPLAVQHEAAFRQLLAIEDMSVLTGAQKPADRISLFGESSIIFATPQTVQNDIIRGMSLSEVSLIVFDEAHRAFGDYAYVPIAREYMRKGKNQLVIGLTASPSSQQSKIKAICSNLNIEKVIAKTEKDLDVKAHVQKTQVEWVRVDMPKEFERIQKLLKAVMNDELLKLKKSGYLDGPLSGMGKRKILDLQQRIRRDISAGGQAFKAASTVAAIIKVNHALELLETQGIRALDEYFTRLRAQKSKAVASLMRDLAFTKAMTLAVELKKSGFEHPKIGELVRIVGEYKGRKVLVFTQYRDSVDMIIEHLNKCDILAHEFIGQASRGVKSGMTQKRQIEVLERFRRGEYTALIATSVAEEGLDIPSVDAVIFYEPVPSEIRSIQRRGRTGRSQSGKVYVLITRGTRDEAYYWSSHHKEKRMSKIVSEMGSLKLEAPEKDPMQKSLASYSQEKSLRVIVDSREKNNMLLDELRGECEIQLMQLTVGDFLVSEDACIERKTVGDFLQSIVDKRLLKQLAEMRRNHKKPILIIEGTEGIYSQRQISEQAIRGHLASAVADFSIPVISTADPVDTARMIVSIARREQTQHTGPIALQARKKPELLRERQRFIMESLPNVSAILADRILKHFGCVEKALSAGKKELLEVEGLGDKKADEIMRVVKSPYSDK